MSPPVYVVPYHRASFSGPKSYFNEYTPYLPHFLRVLFLVHRINHRFANVVFTPPSHLRQPPASRKNIFHFALPSADLALHSSSSYFSFFFLSSFYCFHLTYRVCILLIYLTSTYSNAYCLSLSAPTPSPATFHSFSPTV